MFRYRLPAGPGAGGFGRSPAAVRASGAAWIHNIEYYMGANPCQRAADTAVDIMNAKLKQSVVRSWTGPGGYRQVLAVGIPLVMSMISNTIMQFTDRVFLSNYSLETIAAALPAGIASFLFISFFMGVGEYVSVFVAQYTGAGRHERVGAALWQGIWFCLPAWVILASLGLLAETIFGFSGHAPHVVELEVTYFRILSMGAGFAVLSAVLSCFYSGRGMTKAVMLVNMAGMLINVPLDYFLIYGVGPFPEMGIAGAGLATVMGGAMPCVLFAFLIFRQENERLFRIRSAWRPDMELLRRLMRYGLPGGIQFFLDMFAVTFFIFVVGRLGTTELAATNIIMSLDSVAFLPCVGLQIAVSILVGQYIGAGKPDHGARATRHAAHLGMLYMGSLGVLYVFAPEPILHLFRPMDMTPEQFLPVEHMGVIMLRFVAAYSVLDALVLVYSGALKGAGDTRFVMWTILASSLGVMIVPLYVSIAFFRIDYIVPWTIFFSYALTLATVFAIRFHQGRWREMRVIEESTAPATLATAATSGKPHSGAAEPVAEPAATSVTESESESGAGSVADVEPSLERDKNSKGQGK